MSEVPPEPTRERAGNAGSASAGPAPSRSAPTAGPTAGPRLLDRLTFEARRRRLSLRTERAYRAWVRRYILFHVKRHPASSARRRSRPFSPISRSSSGSPPRPRTRRSRRCSSSTANVLGHRPRSRCRPRSRSQRPVRLPIVLSREEARRLLAAMGDGIVGMVARLLYGSGLRLLEAPALARQGPRLRRATRSSCAPARGRKDRRTMLPASARGPAAAAAARTPAHSTSRPARRGTARSSCPTRWRGSSRPRRGSGRGSGSSPRRVDLRSDARDRQRPPPPPPSAARPAGRRARRRAGRASPNA